MVSSQMRAEIKVHNEDEKKVKNMTQYKLNNFIAQPLIIFLGSRICNA